VLLVFAVITGLAGAVLSRAEISSDVKSMFFGDSPEYARYIERTREFSNDLAVVVGFEASDLLTEKGVERLRHVVGKLEEHPDLRRVHSVLGLQRVRVENGVLTMDYYVDEALEHPERAKEIMAELMADPLAGGLLMSRDGRHSAVVIELATEGDGRTQKAEDTPLVLKHIIQVFVDAGFDEAGLHRTGMIAVLGEVMHQISLNIGRLFPVVCVMLLITVFVMFHRLWPVLITGVVSLVAVIWTMGFAVLLVKQINVLVSMIPAIIVIIAFADVIHLCSSYLLELAHGEGKEAAIEKSCGEVGQACLFTSLTTFFGFISLAFVPTPIFRQMGVALGFGVASALFIAITITPIIFSLMPQPKQWRTGAAAKSQNLLDSFLDLVQRIATGRPKTVVAVFAALLAASIFGAWRINIETDFTRRLAEDNRLRVDERFFAENFVGTNFLDVFIESDEDGGLLEPEVFAGVAELQDSLEAMPAVDKAMSAVDLVRIFHREFEPDKARVSPVPRTKKEISRYLYLFEMSDDNEDLGRMIDFDRRTMRLGLCLKDDGVYAAFNAGEAARAHADEILGGRARVEVSGLTYLLGDWLDNIVTGQKRGLAFAFTTIMIMMMIALRSLSAGAWSMIPNAIPLLALGGYLGLFWEATDSDTMAMAVIAIGIGVDDTIHFLMRYRLELKKTGDVTEAIDKTFHYSGRAIVITTVILLVGFAPFALSDYFTTRIMGTLLPGCLVMALAADLLLVPALVKLGAFRFRGTARTGM
jgi:predicted RND superfamily exporter protein